MSVDVASMQDLLQSARTPEELEQVEAWINEELADQDEIDSELEAGIAHGQTALERQNARTALTQEIGPLPPIKDPARRARCKNDLKQFVLTYFDRTVYLGLSPYQLEMVTAFQAALMMGGNKCRAVRRGGLKSTLLRIAAIWAVTNGHRRFPVPVGATDDKSNEHRDNIMSLLTSPKLIEDYPELIPLVMKFRNPKKQLRLNGELLKVTAKDERGCIVFPNIRGTECFCARIAPYSIMATDVSGLGFVDDDHIIVRPDCLMYDDVQTPQSAASFVQTNDRENSIVTTFAGLGGLGVTICAIMVCTRREKDDLTSRFCDRDRHPDWDGKKYPVLIAEPTNKKLWTDYAALLRTGDTPEQGLAAATSFYLEHHAAMKEGGRVAWEFDKEEQYVDCLQWAMTIKLIRPSFFRTELQQEGAEPASGLLQLDAALIVKRLSHVPRGIVPIKTTYLTAFVDSQDEILFWMVCGWANDFSGWIIDRGTWPDQQRDVIYKSDIGITISSQLPHRSWEEAFVNAHNEVDKLLLRDWLAEDGSMRSLDLLLKDWGSGTHRPRIESQILASVHRSRIRPSKGFGPKPGTKPVHKYGHPDDDRNTGQDWVERRTESPVHVQFDANKWKGHAARRLQTVEAAPSSVLLYGSDELEHGILAEHLTAEQAKPLIYNNTPGTVYELIVSRDNDWWDAYVGNNVAASMLGCCLPGEIATKQEGRETVPMPPGFIRGGRW